MQWGDETMLHGSKRPASRELITILGLGIITLHHHSCLGLDLVFAIYCIFRWNGIQMTYETALAKWIHKSLA